MVATICISILLAALVARAIAVLVRRKKQGKSSCGCDCGSCGACTPRKDEREG